MVSNFVRYFYLWMPLDNKLKRSKYLHKLFNRGKNYALLLSCDVVLSNTFFILLILLKTILFLSCVKVLSRESSFKTKLNHNKLYLLKIKVLNYLPLPLPKFWNIYLKSRNIISYKHLHCLQEIASILVCERGLP